MPTLTTTKTYADGDILFESDLDQIRTDIETFLNTTKIDDDNIQDSGITASTKLIDGTITAAKMGTDSVTTSKIADAQVTAVKLATDSVTTAKIEALAVTAAKLAADSVTTAKILDANVTKAKLAALGQQISSSSGSYTRSSTIEQAVTNLSVTITTTGRPVYVGLISGDSSDYAYIGIADGDSTNTIGQGLLRIYRDSTIVSQLFMSVKAGPSLTDNGAVNYPPGSVFHIDTPAAGTYTYSVKALSLASSSNTVTVSRCALVAFEL